MKTITSNRMQDFRDIIANLSPTTLAAISVELEVGDRTNAANTFLDEVDRALVANVGDDEAEQLRLWVRENM